jgi:peptidoglycan/LPS O-acetylase OafA/YrhL
VEEQYYLIWPHVLRIARRRLRSDRNLALLASGGAVLATLLRWQAFAHGHIRFATYSTVTRVDGVLWGSALALALSAGMPWLTSILRRGAVALGAAVALVALTIARLGVIPWQLRITLVELAAAAIVGHLALRREGVCARVLSVQPLPAIGRISYGLYLFHVPVQHYFIHRTPTLWQGAPHVAAAFAATFALAIVSFLLVERPALRLKARFEPALDAPAAAVRRA